jgi:hypothetical protein
MMLSVLSRYLQDTAFSRHFPARSQQVHEIFTVLARDRPKAPGQGFCGGTGTLQEAAVKKQQ